MNPAILNPTSLAPVSPPPARQNADTTSSEPFREVLSREVAGRDGANAGNQGRLKENGNPDAPSQPLAAPSAKRSSSDRPGQAADIDNDAAAAAASAELLMLVANNHAELETVSAEPATAIDQAPTDSAVALPLLLPREQISDASIESSIVPLAAAMPGRRPAANLSVTGAAIEAAAAVHRPPESTAVFGSPTQDGMPRLLPGTPSSLDRDAASAVLVRPTDSGGAPTSSGQAGAPASQTGLMAATQPLPSLHNTAGVPEIQPGPAIAAPLQAAPNNIHAAVPATEQVAPHVGTTGWDQAVGQKVVWMVAGAQSSASLTLNPPNLGPLQVALSVVNNQTVISFTAAQPEVRHALEAAMPKLREMLDNVGIQMGETSVSAGAPQQHGKNGEPDHAPRRFGQTNADINVSPPAISNRPADGKEGMIDTFV